MNRNRVSRATHRDAVKVVERFRAENVAVTGVPTACPRAFNCCRVTWYATIGEPPLAGAVHRTVTVSGPPIAPRAAVTLGGMPGVPIGFTAADVAEYVPEPISFTARTRNRYMVPLVKPVTVSWEASAAARRTAPTVAPVAALTTCTWYPVMAAPPSSAGAVHRT